MRGELVKNSSKYLPFEDFLSSTEDCPRLSHVNRGSRIRRGEYVDHTKHDYHQIPKADKTWRISCVMTETRGFGNGMNRVYVTIFPAKRPPELLHQIRIPVRPGVPSRGTICRAVHLLGTFIVSSAMSHAITGRLQTRNSHCRHVLDIGICKARRPRSCKSEE
jgi:hypothetical protein